MSHAVPNWRAICHSPQPYSTEWIRSIRKLLRICTDCSWKTGHIYITYIYIHCQDRIRQECRNFDTRIELLWVGNPDGVWIYLAIDLLVACCWLRPPFSCAPKTAADSRDWGDIGHVWAWKRCNLCRQYFGSFFQIFLFWTVRDFNSPDVSQCLCVVVDGSSRYMEKGLTEQPNCIQHLLQWISHFQPLTSSSPLKQIVQKVSQRMRGTHRLYYPSRPRVQSQQQFETLTGQHWCNPWGPWFGSQLLAGQMEMGHQDHYSCPSASSAKHFLKKVRVRLLIRWKVGLCISKFFIPD